MPDQEQPHFDPLMHFEDAASIVVSENSIDVQLKMDKVKVFFGDLDISAHIKTVSFKI